MIRYWTEKEVEFLKGHYQRMKYSDMAKILNRSVRGVADKIVQLGLKKHLWTRKKVEWTATQIENLRREYPQPSFSILTFAKANNKTPRQVAIKAFRLGIKRLTWNGEPYKSPKKKAA